jgi:S-adenosylmethionine:tRNA ribosyltransferase-isomerase
MLTRDFDFPLPKELIAQAPIAQRDESRLLVLDRSNGRILHQKFRDLLHCMQAGDVLVLNNSGVIPARLRGSKDETSGQVEILLLEENQKNDWQVLLYTAGRAMLWLVVISACTSMYGYFSSFYRAVVALE